MTLEPLGVLDLSIVTDQLINLLEYSRDNSPLWTLTNPQFTIQVTGAAPESVRTGGDCQLSLYLFHVSQRRFQRNAPVTGTRARASALPHQPLSLELYYLLTAFADANYIQEQQAMSIALRCFHENPIVRHTVLIEGTNVNEEFCLTMEVESADELSRMWQATTAAHRLSAVYKVSVVFITPPAPTQGLAPGVLTIHLSVDPTALPLADSGQVIGTLRVVSYLAPDASGSGGILRSYELSPATVAAGEEFFLIGAGLNQATSQQVYLLLNGEEYDISAWKAPDPDPPTSLSQTEARMTLRLPTTVGALPANTPPPGIYQLRVGVDGPMPYRSNATPFSIAARIPGPILDPSILAPTDGLFTIEGLGFSANQTEVLLDKVALVASAAAPNPGEFRVNPAETTLTFRPPPNLPAGRYSVRVLVSGVESAPAWWIVLP